MLKALMFLAVLASGAAPAAAEGPVTLRSLADEAAIIRITNAIDVAVDRKDWAKARSFFADEVRVDFTSLAGGQLSTIKADALVGAWRGNLGPKKTSLHIRGNHRVTIAEDRARVTSHGYAWNRLEGNGDPLWEVWGHYTHELQRTPQGWKVTAMTFVMTHELGNMWVKTTPAP